MADYFKNLPARFTDFYYRHASLDRLKRLMKYTEKGKRLPVPRFMFVEPTNACNYNCPKCPQADGLDRPKATLDVDLFRELVLQLAPHRTSVSLHHSGESFLHPRLFDLIRIARDAGLYTTLMTNASLLNIEDFRVTREGPDEITFSIDGVTPDDYEPPHGGAPWEKVARNIEEFFRRLDSKSPIKKVQIILIQNGQTPEQLQAYMDFARSFPFYAMYIKPAFKWPDGKDVAPIPETPPNHWPYPCGHPWLSPAILADGSVVPCCLDAHGQYRAGNINDEPFIEIYNNSEMDRLRRHLMDLDETPPLPLCDSCGIKRLSMPFSRKGWFLFKTLPFWKLFFRNLQSSIDA